MTSPTGRNKKITWPGFDLNSLKGGIRKGELMYIGASGGGMSHYKTNIIGDAAQKLHEEGLLTAEEARQAMLWRYSTPLMNTLRTHEYFPTFHQDAGDHFEEVLQLDEVDYTAIEERISKWPPMVAGAHYTHDEKYTGEEDE